VILCWLAGWLASLADDCLDSFTSDSSSELKILWHDCNSLGVDGTQVGVLKKSNKVRLSSLLKSEESLRMETHVLLEVVGDFTDKTLEWQLSDQQFRASLVLADLPQCHCSRSESVRFLNTRYSWITLTSSL
jgi:hypothetical protein